MKYLLAVVSALVCVGFVGAAHHVGMATQCYNCMGMNPDACMMQMVNCSDDTFPNFGMGKHCYTAVGWYRNMANAWISSVIRGCANCSDKDALMQSLGNLTGLSMGSPQWGFSLMHLNLTCCTSDNCNNIEVSLLPHPSSTSTSMSMSTMHSPDRPEETQAPTSGSGDYAKRLSPLAFVLIAIVLLFK
ncbi:uncharacterized protein [Montipora capricornis]|uniref:uncharacterized protein n=1 Tax=Montipora capricornis TaxID=246305 RepID=UPI0035F12B04